LNPLAKHANKLKKEKQSNKIDKKRMTKMRTAMTMMTQKEKTRKQLYKN